MMQKLAMFDMNFTFVRANYLHCSHGRHLFAKFISPQHANFTHMCSSGGHLECTPGRVARNFHFFEKLVLEPLKFAVRLIFMRRFHFCCQILKMTCG